MFGIRETSVADRPVAVGGALGLGLAVLALGMRAKSGPLAALTGGAVTIPKNQPKAGVWNNMLTIVFDPARFGTQNAFETSTREFVEWVKSARLMEGHDEILMPGDPERQSRKARAEAVPIDEGTIAEMDVAADMVRGSSGKGPGALSALMQVT